MAELGQIERGHAVCWGYLLSGSNTPTCAPVPIKARPAFRERFCTTCRAGGVQIHASRLRVVCSGRVSTNNHGGGCWNEGPDVDGWPPHRVVNQTSNCIGPPIVILKVATPAPLYRLGEFPHGWYTFRVGRTLAPLLGPHPPPLALAPTAGVMHMTPPTLTLTETGRTLDELVSSASLWTQEQRMSSQASLTSTELSYVIGIPLHEAIPGVLFSAQVISPRDELQQHRSAALHFAAIGAAAATSAAAAAASVARSFAAAHVLPLADMASVPTGLASCATAPAQPGHASMSNTTSLSGLPQRLRTAGVLTAGEVARYEARVQQLAAAVSPSAIPAPVPALPLHNPRAVFTALETAGRAVAPPPPPEGQVLHEPSDACAASALLDLFGGAAAGIAPQGATATGAEREVDATDDRTRIHLNTLAAA
mmetsp:Transcript_52203/g.174285  ORF Transcript_52203/g.174285 Transcript_52203/m.174285 type:complete len:423 (+) Transcript_52203:33-1301(+)